MKEFIDKNNLMFSSQYAFCKSHSTEHAILDIVEAILSNMDKPYFSCGVFIDLIQSIIKLNFYGFRGLINDWFQSYLKKLNANNSNWRVFINLFLPVVCPRDRS